MAKKYVRVTHLPADTGLEEGPLGWGITPFEGNLCIRRSHLLTDKAQGEPRPGLLPLQVPPRLRGLKLSDDDVSRNLGWNTGCRTRSSRSSGSGLAGRGIIQGCRSRSSNRRPSP